MQPKGSSLSQLMGIRLLSPSPTILRGSGKEPGVPVSIQLILKSPLQKMQMDICDIWISLTRTTEIHTTKAKLRRIVSTSAKVQPKSNDAYRLVGESGGTVIDDILRLNATELILTDRDGLSSHAEAPVAFNIFLRIPGDLAGTVETTLGSISYTISASAVTCSGGSHAVGIPLYVRRLKVASSIEVPPVYLRRYPKTTMTSEMMIPQVVSADGVFQAQLVLRNTVSSGDGTSTCWKVIEAMWAIDEIVRVVSIPMPDIENLPSQSIEIKRHARQLSSGRISSSCFRSSSNDNIEIDFVVALTKKSQALCDVQQTYPDRPCNNEAKDITSDCLHAAKRLDVLVYHVLVIELTVDKMILDNETGQRLNLPTLTRHVHGSSYLLRVGDVKLENEPSREIEYLPQYSKFPTETPLVSGGQYGLKIVSTSSADIST